MTQERKEHPYPRYTNFCIRVINKKQKGNVINIISSVTRRHRGRVHFRVDRFDYFEWDDLRLPVAEYAIILQYLILSDYYFSQRSISTYIYIFFRQLNIFGSALMKGNFAAGCNSRNNKDFDFFRSRILEHFF